MSDTRPTKAEPRVTVCLCTHNRPTYARDCLAGLRKQTVPQERFALLVVDSGSAAGKVGGAGRETAVDAGAPALGTFTRGIAAAEIVGRNPVREARSLERAPGRWPKSCRQVSVPTPALW